MTFLLRMKKIVEEKVNTISASINDQDIIDDKNNFVADDYSIEVKEIVKKDANNTPVVNEKIVEENLKTISAAVNESVVIGEKIDFVDEKIVEVKENTISAAVTDSDLIDEKNS